jgi:hypothetical protein
MVRDLAPAWNLQKVSITRRYCNRQKEAQNEISRAKEGRQKETLLTPRITQRRGQETMLQTDPQQEVGVDLQTNVDAPRGADQHQDVEP